MPLLFGMAVVIPPQAYFQALANGAVAPGYLAFLARYFTFQGWPEGAFDGSEIGITWNHLGYLPYLLFYTLVLFAHVALMILFEIVPDDAAGAQQAGLMAVLYFNRWIWLVTVLGWGSALLNRPFRWLPCANEAVYPWYILHQTITVAAGFYLAPSRLGPVGEPVLMVGITVGGCLLLHEYLIRRIGWLRPLFGLKPATGLEPIPRRFAHSAFCWSKKMDPRIRPH